MSASITYATINPLPFYAGQLNSPGSVAVSSWGNVYVSEWGLNGNVQKFNSNGNIIKLSTISGIKGLQDIALDPSGNLYVTCSPKEDPSAGHDFRKIRVQKYGVNSNLITSWEAYPGTIHFYMGGPDFRYVGIAVDSSGYVYTADPNSFRVTKFATSNGVIYNQIGSWDYAQPDSSINIIIHKIPRELYPAGIAVDPSGNVYITDWYYHKVRKFDSNGKFITSWGSKGNGDGEFNVPDGIAVSPAGYILVADRLNNRIQAFDNNGNFLFKFGKKGSSSVEFQDPTGIAIDTSGNVYVADLGNKRVQKFAIVMTTPKITWNNPTDIYEGTPLSSTQLNASAWEYKSSGSLSFWSQVPGYFDYSPQAGTILKPGTHTLHVVFTPADTDKYTKASKDVTIKVKTKITPTITWNNPAPITYGTPLRGAQLNASAWEYKRYGSLSFWSQVPGKFVYNPKAGTILEPGAHTLHVDFTPADTRKYTKASKDVVILVRR